MSRHSKIGVIVAITGILGSDLNAASVSSAAHYLWLPIGDGNEIGAAYQRELGAQLYGRVAFNKNPIELITLSGAIGWQQKWVACGVYGGYLKEWKASAGNEFYGLELRLGKRDGTHLLIGWPLNRWSVEVAGPDIPIQVGPGYFSLETGWRAFGLFGRAGIFEGMPVYSGGVAVPMNKSERNIASFYRADAGGSLGFLSNWRVAAFYTWHGYSVSYPSSYFPPRVSEDYYFKDQSGPAVSVKRSLVGDASIETTFGWILEPALPMVGFSVAFSK